MNYLVSMNFSLANFYEIYDSEMDEVFYVKNRFEKREKWKLKKDVRIAREKSFGQNYIRANMIKGFYVVLVTEKKTK